MKKAISILLAIAMLFAISIPAFAANLTIGDDATRSYNAYQLLNLTTSHKANVNCNDAHTEACYTYFYTVNDAFRAVLQAATGKTEDADILDALQNAADVQALADAIYRAIQQADPAVPVTNITGNTATIDQGYWLVADVTNNAGTGVANSVVMLDTKGQLDVTITPKAKLPTITKKVEDVNDSDAAAPAWQDAADHDITDTVNFKLIATLPQNFASYQAYTLEFHDKLAAGLTLDEESIVVKKYGSATDAANDVNGEVFTFNAVTKLDGDTFAVGANVKVDGVDENTVFVLTYSATLNENAVIGETGNANVVDLVFSNDPYSNKTGKISDTVMVYTYQLTVNKVDDDGQEGNPLAGAVFQLYKLNAETGEYEAYGPVKGVKDGSDSTFVWKGLDDGMYKLREVEAPSGYNKLENDLEFTVSATHTIESEQAPALTALEDGEVVEGVITGNIVKKVVNRTGGKLPETGAMGTMWLILGGTMLVVLAGVFMITRKKMSVYED